MNPRELAQNIIQKNPALSALPVAQAMTLLRAAFDYVGDAVDGTAEGMVKVPGLGVFRVKQVEREVEGKKVSMKVVMFRRIAGTRRAEAPKAEAPKKSTRR